MLGAEPDDGTDEGAGSPCRLVSYRWPGASYEAAHLGVPCDSGGMPLLDVLLDRVHKLKKRLCPSNSSGIATSSAHSQVHNTKCQKRTHVSLNCLVTLSAQNWDEFFISPT